MTEATSALHLALASAAREKPARISRWLRSASGCDSKSLLAPAPLEQAGLTETQARKLLNRSGNSARLPAGWHSLALGDPGYPALLATLDDAPAVLFVKGDPTLLDSPQVAMVGSRHPSMEGRENAYRFARVLAAAGFTVTSGLALGIDARAHEGALAAGTSIAVLGCGPDQLYPQRNRALALELARRGALVTEFPPGAGPLKAHFPRRNRIISGLSLATVVVEAASGSGSLITARLAAEQGREVFAIPGSIHNPMSKGCHRLLREGANWLESVEDLMASLDAMEQLGNVGMEETQPAMDPVLAAFTGGINSLDQLQQRTGLDTAELARRLTALELAGEIERLPGGYQSRMSSR